MEGERERGKGRGGGEGREEGGGGERERRRNMQGAGAGGISCLYSLAFQWLDAGSGIFIQASGHRGSRAQRGPAGVPEPGGPAAKSERNLAPWRGFSQGLGFHVAPANHCQVE